MHGCRGDVVTYLLSMPDPLPAYHATVIINGKSHDIYILYVCSYSCMHCCIPAVHHFAY